MVSKVYLVSLGCPKNQVDAEVLLGMLLQEGFIYVNNPEEADVIIVNTCAFIKEAVEESIETILEMATFKSPHGLLVVSGCLPQRYKGEIEKEMPEVDLWIGPGDIPRLPALLKRKSKGAFVGPPEAFLYNHTHPRVLFNNPFVAYVKVSEGCLHRCSFCTIPSIRGRFRSRKLEDILKEVQVLVNRGVREIVLVGQDTTAYGKDLGLKDGLLDLLRSLLKVEGRFWVRLLYCYPLRENFPEEMLEMLSTEGKLAPYLDIPIQHISDKVLRLMNRRTTKSELLGLLELLRDKYPQIALRTTVIVGFPGEGEKEFQELLELVKQGYFTYLGAFKFSAEEGTRAAKFGEQVPEEIKEERWQILMETQREITKYKNTQWIGKEVQVLAESVGPENTLIGRTPFQAPEIDGVCLIKRNFPLGEVIHGKVKEVLTYDLVVE